MEMAHSVSNSDTTVSPTLSPFSTYSKGTSEISSDDPVDLGSFVSVFRALSDLQPRTRAIPVRSRRRPTLTDALTATATPTNFASDDDYDRLDPPPPAHGLSRSLPPTSRIHDNRLGFTIHSDSLEEEDEEEESDSLVSEADGDLDHLGMDLGPGEEVEIELIDAVSGEVLDAATLDGETPTLELKAAMQFLAEERARLAAQIDGKKGTSASPDSGDARRRRKRKKGSKSGSRGGSAQMTVQGGKLLIISSSERDGDAEKRHSSSSPDYSSPTKDSSQALSFASSSPSKRSAANGHNNKQQAKRGVLRLKTLHHSKSSPALPLVSPVSPSVPHPHVARLRKLARRLTRDFPEDASYLKDVLSWNQPLEKLVDPRGAIPQPGDTLYHVFVDHSNIIVGFIERLKKRPLSNGRKMKTMSFAAFCLVVERGRPITRRCMAASRPLVQPVDGAVDLGYDVSIYDRVLAKDDATTDSTTQTGSNSSSNNTTTTTNSTSSNGKQRPARRARHDAPEPTSADSDPGMAPLPRGNPASLSPSKRSPHSHKRTQSGPPSSLPTSTSLLSTGPPHLVHAHSTSYASTATGRLRMKEQGVDELLQLKLYQATTHDAPPGGTIVLATGDGNAGEFNEEGFLGCVRNALGKGWRVELYAWEDGLSRAWRREFADVSPERFKIVPLDKYVEDLVDVL